MRELVEVEFSDGRTMWATLESEHEPRDVGLGKKFTGLPGLSEVVEWVSSGVATGLHRAKPDVVTTEFGIELAVGEKGLVAALGGVGAKANVKVTLTWGKAAGAPDEPGAEPPAGEPG